MQVTAQQSLPDAKRYSLVPLGLLAALLPLLTIHLSLFFSLYQGHLDICNPYWVACHSVSATGRHGVAYFVFKGGMICAMSLLALFWIVNHIWLRQTVNYRRGALAWLGIVASIALIVYTLSLGHSGGAFYILRRAGVVTYLGLTFIAQSIFSYQLMGHADKMIATAAKRLLRFCLCVLGLALFTLVLDGLPMVHYEPLEDMVEWILVVLLNLHALAVVRLWHRDKLGFSLDRDS